jgi:hypothetical protein
MGIETTTTITCDQCGKDISNEAQFYIGASQSIQNVQPPPVVDTGGPEAPDGPVLTPFVASPPPETASIVLCSEHGGTVWKKMAKLATVQPKK